MKYCAPAIKNLLCKSFITLVIPVCVVISTGASVVTLAPSSFAEASNPSIKFASMNLHCQFDDWRWRLAQVGQWLAQTQPAVVFFQEVCDGQGQSMTSEIPQILKAAGYRLSSSKSLFAHDAWDGKYKEFILVATLYSDQQSQSNFQWIGGALPGSGMRRVFLGFKLKDTSFIGVHLTSDPPSADDPFTDHVQPPTIAPSPNQSFDPSTQQARTDQINYLAAHFANDQNSSTLIMGDFNSTPGEPEQTAFQSHSMRSYFPGPTEPLPHPKSAIDGAWLTPAFAKKISTAHIEKALDNPIQGRYLSDHAAVILTVESR